MRRGGVDECESTEFNGPATSAISQKRGDCDVTCQTDHFWGPGSPQWCAGEFWQSRADCTGGISQDGSVDLETSTPYNIPTHEKETSGTLRPDVTLNSSTVRMSPHKILDYFYKEMYGDQYLKMEPSQVRDIFTRYERFLSCWQDTLPFGLQRNDSDDSSGNVFQFLLRAEFWRALSVINKPFLDYAIHILPSVQDGFKVEDVAVDVHSKAEVHTFKAIKFASDTDIWEASVRCIEAVVQHTTALHDLLDRGTSVEGIAYA